MASLLPSHAPCSHQLPGNSPLLMEGGLFPQTMELDRKESDPGSLPGQKVGAPSKEEAGIQDTRLPHPLEMPQNL